MLVVRTKYRYIFCHLYNKTLRSCCPLSSLIPYIPQNPISVDAAENTSDSTSFNYHKIAYSFKNWFKSKNPSIIDQISEILASHDDVDEHLSRLHLKLSESLVLSVLSCQNDVSLGLKFFDWAGRQHGYYHTRTTCHAIFKMLSKAKLMKEMLDWLDLFQKQRNVVGVRFYDTLVMGYAVVGRPDIAFKLFGKMRFHGVDLQPFTYHVLLNALVEDNVFDAFEVVAKQIMRRGFENEITSCIRIKNFCKHKRLGEAQAYIRSLKEEGKTVNDHMVAEIVDSLCKQRKFKDARAFMEEFSSFPNIPMLKAYSIWFKNLIETGETAGAIEFLRSKNLEGYLPQTLCYNRLIFNLLRENKLIEVYDLLVEMQLGQIPPDKVTMNAVLCFFCKAGMVNVTIDLYNSRSEIGLTPNTIAYNLIISTLCGDGNLKDACYVLEDLLKQGRFPNKRTFTILIDTLCREKLFDKVQALVDMALQNKFLLSKDITLKCVSSLCHAGRPEDGYLIAGKLKSAGNDFSKYTYYILIGAFIKSKRSDMAAHLFLEMQDRGHSFKRKLFRNVVRCLSQSSLDQVLRFMEMQLSRSKSYHIYNSFIAGAGHSGRPELTKELYNRMLMNGVQPTSETDVLMLQSYLKGRKVNDALVYFDDICKRKNPSNKLYNVLVLGLCTANKEDLAQDHLKKMRKKGYRPSLQCYEELISLLCSSKNYNSALEVLIDLERSGRRASTFIYNVLLMHSMQSREVLTSWLQLSHIHGKETLATHWMFGKLIQFLSGGIVQQDSESLKNISDNIRGPRLLIFFDLIETLIPTNLFTYNMFLRELSRDKKTLDQAYELFRKISKKGYKPNRWSYDALVYGFCMHDRRDDAKILMNEMIVMGFTPTVRTTNLYREIR